MLVLRLVVLPERVRSHAGKLQLGLRVVRGSHGLCYTHVHLPRQACVRGTGSEGNNGGFRVNDGVAEVLGVVSLLYTRNAERSLRKPGRAPHQKESCFTSARVRLSLMA
jgi:hypothetical protein